VRQQERLRIAKAAGDFAGRVEDENLVDVPFRGEQLVANDD
jgi:hypothetical protein